LRRALNNIEYATWIFGQPYNLLAAIRLQGDVDPDRLRIAIDRAQQCHPLLQATIVEGPGGIPWFDSANVGQIPLLVGEYRSEVDLLDAEKRGNERIYPIFDLAGHEAPRIAAPGSIPPMATVELIRADGFCYLICCAQHSIIDGASINIMLRDILRFYEAPNLDACIDDTMGLEDDLLPEAIRLGLPRDPKGVYRFYHLMRFFIKIKTRGRPRPARYSDYDDRIFGFFTLALTKDESDGFFARCKIESVTVHNAVCTAFSPVFEVINSPVNVRSILARPLEDAIGLLVGGALITRKYDPKLSFWENARQYDTKMQVARRPKKIFQFMQLFSTVVPPARMREIHSFIIRNMASKRPMAISNFGSIDASGIPYNLDGLQVDRYETYVSQTMDPIVVLLATFQGCLQFHVNFIEPMDTRDDMEVTVKNALDTIRRAIQEA
jgi:hypothetical protein